MRILCNLRGATCYVWKKKNLLYKWWCGQQKERKTDRGWGERWLTWKVNVCSVKMVMDRAGLSSACARVCVCVRERNREEDMFYAFVFAHMPPSLRLCVPLATSAWICMCVFTSAATRSLGGDWSPPWWAITGRLGWFFIFFLFINFFSYLPVYGNVTYKKCMPFSEVAASGVFALIDCAF